MDKKKLEQMDLSLHTVSGTPFSKMRPEEQYVCELVAKLVEMDVNDLNSNSNFFELGIDSISAITIAKACIKIGLEVRSSDVFSKPTASLLMKHAMKKKMNDMMISKKQSSYRGMSGLKACTPEQVEYFTAQKHHKHAYLAQYIWECKDETLAQILVSGWTFVVDKNEILRSRFVEEGSEVFHLPNASEPITISHITSDLNTFLQDDLQIGFQSTDTHWIRLTRVYDVKNYFVVSMSHLVYDGWSLRLYLQDLQNFATGSVTNPATTIPTHGSKREGEEVKEFWVEYLRDSICLLPPLVLQPVNEESKRLEGVSVKIKDLSIASSNLHTTPRMVLKVAWALTMQQICESNDVVFGEVVTGRESTSKDIEQSTGCLISTIPCRVKVIQGRDTFFSLVQKMAANHVKTAEYTNVSSSLVESWIGRKAFESIFIFQNLNRAFDLLAREWQPSRVNESSLWHEGRDTIELQLFPQKESLCFTIDYFTSQVPDVTAGRLMERFTATVEKLVSKAIAKEDFDI